MRIFRSVGTKMAKTRRKRKTLRPRKMSRQGASRQVQRRKPIKSPFHDKNNAPDEEERRYGDRILKIIPKWRDCRKKAENLRNLRDLSPAERIFLVSDIILLAIKNRRALHFTAPTALEYREMAAIMHGVDISKSSVGRLFPPKKRIVCDWRELRTEYRARRSEAYQAEMAALGQEPGHLFGSQRVFIPRDPRESDSDTDSDT